MPTYVQMCDRSRRPSRRRKMTIPSRHRLRIRRARRSKRTRRRMVVVLRRKQQRQRRRLKRRLRRRRINQLLRSKRPRHRRRRRQRRMTPVVLRASRRMRDTENMTPVRDRARPLTSYTRFSSNWPLATVSLLHSGSGSTTNSLRQSLRISRVPNFMR